jgi:hypothetical protein
MPTARRPRPLKDGVAKNPQHACNISISKCTMGRVGRVGMIGYDWLFFDRGARVSTCSNDFQQSREFHFERVGASLTRSPERTEA